MLMTGFIGATARAQNPPNPVWEQRRSQLQVASFDLATANGWTIKAAPTEQAFASGGSYSSLRYQVEFYRANESSPFETADGTLSVDLDDAQGTFQFNLQRTTPLGTEAAQAELEAINKTIVSEAFQNLSEAEQDAVFARSDALSEQIVQQALAAISPATSQSWEDDFGCRSFTLTRSGAGQVSGTVSCGKNVGAPVLTGTMTAMR